MLTVERLESLPGDAGLERAWKELLARCPWSSLFLTWEWTRTWWEHFGGDSRLWLLVVRDGSEIVGIAPLMVARERYGRLPVRALGFLRNRHTSRAEFIVPERRPEIFQALARYWREHAGEWDVLRLVGMDGATGSAALLARALEGERLDPFPARAHRALGYLPVAGGWEEYVGGWSYRFARSRRNARNRLAAAGPTELLRETRPEEVAASMDRLLELEAASWKASSEIAAFDEADRRFVRALAARLAAAGGLENRFLLLAGRPVAGLHSLIHDRVQYFMLTYYDPAFDHLSPGRQLMERVLEDCWREGRIREVDFNGDSALIRSWTGHARALETLSACNARPYSRLVAGLKRLKRMVTEGGARRAGSDAPPPGDEPRAAARAGGVEG